MALLGNEALRRQVDAMLHRGTLSHCLLLTGPEGSGKTELARYLSMALECEQPRSGAPCGVCSECRRVAGSIHPDVITVDSEDVNIKVSVARDVVADAWIRPNQGRKKIYLFARADALNEAAQNALLKLIEEPPAYGVFLLESRNPDLLLPTVRSRATELRMEPLPLPLLEQALADKMPEQPAAARRAAAQHSDGWLGQALTLLAEGGGQCPEADAILQALTQSNRRAALLNACVPLEKTRREELQLILERVREALAAALVCRSGITDDADARTLANALTARQLAQAAEAVRLAEDRLHANVSAAHIMGALSVRLADAAEMN